MLRKGAHNWSLCLSLEETLNILNKHASIAEVQEVLQFFPVDLNSTNRKQQKHNHSFIVVEGLDACGKSTVCRFLSGHLKGALMCTPGSKFSRFRSFFDHQQETLRRAYYSLSNYAIAAEIDSILEDKPVILDRFWHSTAAYSLASQEDDLPPKGNIVYSWPKDLLPTPDIVLFLQVEEEARLQRHMSRSTTNTNEEKRLAKDISYRQKLLGAYNNFYNPEITVIEASGSIDTVCDAVLLKLKNCNLI